MAQLLDTPALFQACRDSLAGDKIASVLDIGCMDRPQKVILDARHVCVDPCQAYVDRLDKAYEAHRMDWETALWAWPASTFEAITLLDVIEHLEKDEGRRLLARTLEVAGRAVVIFTPYGFVAQEPHGDGGELQRHRSGWVPDDFPGWEILEGVHADGLDPANGRTDPVGCFFAIWRRA